MYLIYLYLIHDRLMMVIEECVWNMWEDVDYLCPYMIY